MEWDALQEAIGTTYKRFASLRQEREPPMEHRAATGLVGANTEKSRKGRGNSPRPFYCLFREDLAQLHEAAFQNIDFCHILPPVVLAEAKQPAAIL